MKREIRLTNDGSTTIYIPEMDENYHSTHGAIQEAKHVFIEHGLKYLEDQGRKEISILEMGFGTGLNAVLTLLNHRVKINYTGIEAYPVEIELINQLNYINELNFNKKEFNSLHEIAWGIKHSITDNFSLKKVHSKIEEWEVEEGQFDLIYFDAFGPRAQGDMWSVEVLKKMVDSLKDGGILVTYCAMGQFKRDLKSLGMSIEALPGPPGKREMTRAQK